MTRIDPQQLSRYDRGQHLRHHAGSVWNVIRHCANGDYRIRCVVGTVREGWIGGEVEGTVRTVHADYLHGNGWMLAENVPTTGQEYCRRCDLDMHRCPGCGVPVDHGTVACTACASTGKQESHD